MKLLTFLGAGTNYKETTYVWQGQEATALFAPLATCCFLKPEQIVVFLTQKAREDNFITFRDKVPAGISVETVDIPMGSSDEELWQIFDCISRQVQPGEEVAFDITHGLRSFPMLGLLAASFLRSGLGVKIMALFYGAFDAPDERGRRPVFDLTPMLLLLEWSAAASRFTETGDARSLVQLLNDLKIKAPAARKAIDSLQTISQAAILCLPFTLSASVGELVENIEAAQGEMASAARPFGLLKDRILNSFSAFNAPGDPQDPHQYLCAEYRIVEWYFNNRQYFLSVTLAREWIIDAVVLKSGLQLDLSNRVRLSMERGVSGLARLGQMQSPEGESSPRAFDFDDLNEHGKIMYQNLGKGDIEDIKHLWNNLQPVRNKFDHAEHQKESIDWRKATVKMENNIFPLIQALAKKWGYC